MDWVNGRAQAGRPQLGLAHVRAIDSDLLSEETVDQALARVAHEQAKGVALMWLVDNGVKSMTWAELWERVCATSTDLLELNPQRGRVAIVATNSVDWVVAMFGCAMAGMAVVPISPSTTASEAHHMLSQSRVDLVLAGDHPTYRRMCKVAARVSWRPIVRGIGGRSEVLTHPLVPCERNPTDEFLVQHTSGTTGLPKAAVLSHRAAFNAARIWGEAIGLRTGETWLNPLPLHHVGGSIAGVLTALSIGATYFVVERFTPEAILRALRLARPTAVGLVPTMIMDLLAMPGVSPSDFSSVRIVAGGAACVDPGLIESVERRLGVTCLVGYGQSEAPAMAASAPSDPPSTRTQTLGHCLPGRDYYICDQDGEVVRTGSVGELCVRGPLTMSGYLRPDGSIDPAVDDAGWLHTGDLCSMDDQGILTFRGRLREVIIRGGENVYPVEVEQVLTAHPSVADAAVFGVPDKRLGERVVAAVLPHGGRINLHNLRAFTSARLSRHKQPAEWVVATTLPRTSSGKVRKHVLRQAYESGALNADVGGLHVPAD